MHFKAWSPYVGRRSRFAVLSSDVVRDNHTVGIERPAVSHISVSGLSRSVHSGFLLIQKHLVINHLRYTIICYPVLTRLMFDIQTFFIYQLLISIILLHYT